MEGTSATILFRPTPIQTLIVAHEGASHIDIIRRWTTIQAKRCQLCSTCRFIPGDDGQGACVVAAPAEIDHDTASEFTLV